MKLKRKRHSFNGRREGKSSRRFEQVTFNLLTNKVRVRTLEGRKHLVVPCVMITEGVHNGSRGPGFYPASETAPTESAWNAMPVVVNHPETEEGEGLSARDPEVLDESKVGQVLNTEWERRKKRLSSELWLDYYRTKEIDSRIIKRIENGQKVEVSTGLFLRRQKKKGVYNGERYTWIARNQVPDHLAILPDEKGACSIKKGCGILANSKGKCKCGISNRSFSAAQRKSLAKKGKALPDGSFPIANSQDLHNAIQAFGRAKDKAAAKRHIIKMAKRMGKTSMLPADWKIARNASPVFSDPALSVRDLVLLSESPTENRKMLSTKKKSRLVRRLINNSGVWSAKDKKVLMAMPDLALKKIVRSAIHDDDDADEGILKNREKRKKKIVKNDASGKKVKKKLKLSMKDLPPEVLSVVNRGLTMEKRRKKALIEIIANSENNKFSDKWLKNQELDVLEGLAEMASPANGEGDEEDSIFVPGYRPNYGGAAGAPTSNRRRNDDDDDEDDEDGLEAPELFPVHNEQDDDDDDRPKKGKKKIKERRSVAV